MNKLLRSVLFSALAVCSASAFAGDWTADPATGCTAWNPNPQPGETITWSGACVDGKASGEGTLTYVQNGAAVQTVSCSSFAEGVCSGKQKITSADGTTDEGETIKGAWQGKVVAIRPNGDRYEWQFVDGKRQKKGAYASADGHRYEGDFDNATNSRSGKGIYVWPSGERYEGDFVNGKRTGKGIYNWPDGTRYEGEFVDGNKQGYGEEKPQNGAAKRGIWVASKLERPCSSDNACAEMKAEFATPIVNCKVNDVDINQEYRGECRNGLAHGKGRAKGRDVYFGEFKDGNTHGQGTYTWATGDSYEGSWVNGERIHGKYKGKNGTYEGDFLNKNYQGFGVYKYSCSCSFWSCETCTDKGWWLNGKLARSCDSKDACEKLNRLEPQIRKAEKEFRCEEAKKLNQELEAVNASAFYFDSCVSERRFNALQRSNDPQEMYLAAGRYESDGERSRAKTIYRQIVDRFAKNPIAIKATDRLTRLADVESVESVGAANRDAVNSVNRRNAEQCQNNRLACFSGCQIHKNYSQRTSCENGCPLCAN